MRIARTRLVGAAGCAPIGAQYRPDNWWYPRFGGKLRRKLLRAKPRPERSNHMTVGGVLPLV